MSDTPETDGITFYATKDMMPPYNTVPSEFARKLERERDHIRVALEEIASLDTSQDASPQQCEAVLIAMNALNK
jgi:hypothetical protein